MKSLCHVRLLVTPWTAARLLFLPSVSPSIRVFSYEPAFSHQVVNVLERQPSINVTSVLLVTTLLLLVFIQMAFPLVNGIDSTIARFSLSILSASP